jgi:hypothetical protein
MSSFGYFCYLSRSVMEFLVFLAPITGLFMLAITGGTLATFSREGTRRVPAIVAAFVPAVLPALILLVGVAFVRSESTSWGDGLSPPIPWFDNYPPPHPDRMLVALPWFHIPLGAILIWWDRKGWPLVLAASLWWGWVSVVASGVATMSVTGMWL